MLARATAPLTCLIWRSPVEQKAGRQAGSELRKSACPRQPGPANSRPLHLRDREREREQLPRKIFEAFRSAAQQV